MEPGYEETWGGHTFGAVDAEGEPRPPGDYLAVIDADEGTIVLRAALTVTDPGPPDD